MYLVQCTMLLHCKGMTRQLARWVANESESDPHQISLLSIIMIGILMICYQALWQGYTFIQQPGSGLLPTGRVRSVVFLRDAHVTPITLSRLCQKVIDQESETICLKILQVALSPTLNWTSFLRESMQFCHYWLISGRIACLPRTSCLLPCSLL